MFTPKSVCVGGWRPPPQRVGAPQWEILDPPLTIHKKPLQRDFFYTDVERGVTTPTLTLNIFKSLLTLLGAT